jgi:GDSL-like Lipase/Acylhydrolase family
VRRASALALVLLVLGPPASAGALSRSLLVDGDSLALGTKPYLPRALGGWNVRQSVSVSRHANQGAAVLRTYGRSLPRVIHVSLGTNDDPRAVGAFRAAVDDVMDVAGDGRCVVWTNIVRPPANGRSYAGFNRVLARESKQRDNLIVVDWAKLARAHRSWFGSDGVHPVAAGYQARAKAIAKAVKRCR